MVRVPGQGEVRAPGPGPALPAATEPAGLLTGPDIQAATADLQALLAEQEAERRREIAAAEAQEVRTAVIKGETELRLRADSLFEEAVRDPDHGTLAQRFDTALSEEIETRIQALPAEAREPARVSYELVRQAKLLTALGTQRERTLAAAERSLEESLENFRVEVFRNPESLESARFATAAIIRSEGTAVGLSEAAVERRIDENDRALVLGALRGLPAEKAAKLLKDGAFDDTLSVDDLDSLTGAFTEEALRQRAADVAEIQSQAEADIARIVATGEGVPGFLERAAAVLDQNAFDDLVRDRKRALSVHEAVSGFALATPRQINKTLQRFRPEPNSDDPIGEQRAFDLVWRASQEVLSLRQQDAASAALQDPSVRKAYQIAGGSVEGTATAPNDPELLQAAVNRSLAVQEALGIAPQFRRILTRPQAKAIVQELESGPVEDAAPRMRALQETYGVHFQRMLKDLHAEGLSPGTQLLALVADDIVLSPRLAQVLRMEEKELQAGLDAVALREVPQELDDAFLEFRSVFMLGDLSGGRQRQVNALAAGLRKLALSNLQRGDSPRDAAENAVEVVFGSRLAVLETVYYPRVVEGIEVTPVQVEQMLENALTREAIEAFAPDSRQFSRGRRDIPDAVASNAVIDTALNSGFFVTKEDGTGVVLIVPFVSGFSQDRGTFDLGSDTAGLPLLDKNGNRYELPWSEILKFPRQRPLTPPGQSLKRGTTSAAEIRERNLEVLNRPFDEMRERVRNPTQEQESK